MTGGIVGLYFQPPGLRAIFGLTGMTPGGGTDTPIAVAVEKVRNQQELAVVSEGDVVAMGRLIPDGDVVTVSAPYGSGDARVLEINVAIADVVAKGDILAVLDNLYQLETAITIAEAALEVRRATLAQTRIATDASLKEAQASLDRAQATADADKNELERMTTLLERGVITRSDFDRAQTAVDESVRDVERARATLSRYMTSQEVIQADVAVAEANVMAAEAELARARADLEKAYVRALSDGQVLDILVRPGEKSSGGGLIKLGQTGSMTAEIEVYQTMIGRVAIGDPVVMQSPALSRDLSGRVAAIGLEIGRQSITADDPAANTDARVVDIIVKLDAESSSIAAAFTNLEVIARIDAGRQP